MSWMVDGVGRFLAHYLEKPVQGYEPFTPSDPDALRATLRPCDVLLVEGNKSYFRRHQVSDAVDLVARRTLCRTDRRSRDRRR